MPLDDERQAVVWWGGATAGSTEWATFPADTDYFGNRDQPLMVNHRVDNLEATMGRLRAAGVRVDPERYHDANERFGWAWDPEGHRFELREPAEAM